MNWYIILISHQRRGKKMEENKSNLNNHANQKNPNSEAHKKARDNRANQKNPNNKEYKK